MNIKYNLFTLVCFIILFVACDASQDKQVIGKWKDTGEKNANKAVFEFLDDGTFINPGADLKGKWNILKDGRIKVVFDVLSAGSMVTLGTINGDTMKLTLPDNKGVLFLKKIGTHKKVQATEKDKIEIDTYYPPKEGLKQVIHFKNDLGDEKQEHRETVVSLPYQELKGKKVFPIKTIYSYTKNGQEGSVRITYYAKDQEGIYTVADQFIIEGNSKPIKYYEAKKYILKNPLKSGNEWKYEINNSKGNRNIKTRIESIEDIITVPAGTFEGCVMVYRSGRGILKNGTEIKNEVKSWFAPNGVGIVKVIYIDERTIKGRTIVSKMEGQLESQNE